MLKTKNGIYLTKCELRALTKLHKDLAPLISQIIGKRKPDEEIKRKC
jgi:hypothetical protein